MITFDLVSDDTTVPITIREDDIEAYWDLGNGTTRIRTGSGGTFVVAHTYQDVGTRIAQIRNRHVHTIPQTLER